jgi:hypothetical protein
VEKMLGCYRVSLRREHEIDGVSGRIDGALQTGPLAGDANVGFVDTPGTIRQARISPDAFIQVWDIPQHPARDRGMIHPQTTLGHQLLQIAMSKAISQVPPDAQDDDLTFKMAFPEQSWSRRLHSGSRYQRRTCCVCDRSKKGLLPDF